MSEKIERSTCAERLYERTINIISRNDEVRLSKETLLKLRRTGLRLIPQLRIES